MEMIHQIWEKCKSEWFVGLVFVLTVLLAFGLGRLSVLTPAPVPVTITTPNTTVGANSNLTLYQDNLGTGLTNNKINVAGKVVASKEGSKYHLPTCSGAKRIKPENLISFESAAAASAAGYEPAANCPGL